MNSFLQLLEIHRSLDVVFAEHQYALLHFEFVRAAELLTDYQDRLVGHIQDEETYLLPLYAERAAIEKTGEVKLFINEHEKMRNFVDLFKETTEQMLAEEHPEPLVLKLLDRQSFYKRLVSHHDVRETEILYPSLDRITDDSERLQIFDQLTIKA